MGRKSNAQKAIEAELKPNTFGETDTETAPAPETATEGGFKKSFSYFDLDAKKDVTVEKVVPFVPAKDFTEAMERIGNDEAILTAAVNDYSKKQAIAAVREEVEKQGVSTTVLFGFIRNMRLAPPFCDMYVSAADENVVTDDAKLAKKDKDGNAVVNRTAQTEALIAFVADNPVMRNMVIGQSARARATEE